MYHYKIFHIYSVLTTNYFSLFSETKSFKTQFDKNNKTRSTDFIFIWKGEDRQKKKQTRVSQKKNHKNATKMAKINF